MDLKDFLFLKLLLYLCKKLYLGFFKEFFLLFKGIDYLVMSYCYNGIFFFRIYLDKIE